VAAPTAGQEIVLVLPSEINPDTEAWDAIARKEAGDVRVGYRLVRPEPNDPPSKQGELIKQVDKSGSALLVVTNRSPETTAALASLSAENRPIVLLGRSLPESPEAAKVKATLVAYEPIEISAKKLAVAVIEDARKTTGADPIGPFECILIKNTFPDESNVARAAALETQAKAAGLTIVATVSFNADGADLNRQLVPLFKAHPKLAAILSDDETALSGITAGRQEDVGAKLVAPGMQKADLPPPTDKGPAGPDYRIAGYIVTRTNINLAKFGQASAVADRNAFGLVKRAIQASRDGLEGKPMPKQIEVEMPVTRSKQFSAKVQSL